MRHAPEDAPAQRRPRLGREATRAAILAAARQAWTEHGYDEIGLRDIAGRAGVTAAMVNRYFGTKETLFREAVGTRDPSPAGLQDIDPARFGEAIAELLLTGDPDGATPPADAYRAILMLLRSAPSPAAQPVLRDHVQSTVIPPLAAYFGDDETAADRAALVLSMVFGVVVMRQMLGVTPLGDGTADQRPAATRVLAAMLQAAVETRPVAADPG